MSRKWAWMLFGMLTIIGCSQVREDVSKDPLVSMMVGRKYKTNKELLVFAFSDNKRALMVDDFGKGSDVPPRDKVGAKFPKRYGTIIMHGVLPPETEFVIRQVMSEGNTG
jgi:hypothetical protein